MELARKKLTLVTAITFALAGNGFAQQQTAGAPAANEAVGNVSATAIGAAAIAAAIVAVASDRSSASAVITGITTTTTTTATKAQ